MLSYRHAFHAGNHADVLKHFLLVELLSYLNQKDKPYWYIDSHAGAGAYSLTEGYATKNAEFANGIARLWERKDLPEPLARYVEVVRGFNPTSTLAHYPGSPLVAQAVMRRDDKLRLFELHPSDSALLEANIEHFHRQAVLQVTDGFNGLKSVLPPAPRRGLTLIDPPYEEKQDYQRVIKALQMALERFATGIYAIWYPCLQREEARELPGKLKGLPVKSWLRAELYVQGPSADGFGMHGSGMFILNPPYTLHGTLQTVLPLLVDALGLDGGARFVLEQQTA
ncbi:23S rRNA (adenine2030-N6)-methyltransferase [Andreprevotia lacus DSM 23236]|jgi:23S rRNA (adenine2030-N6)-methyltransferase|uniref:Ribosomal RNA large subunit methyltransferase J n=1 Tax=Andreprevotia lacus DSM 23236 TaxID=1121001 RepID=A0A1W1XQ93_9NEIS|nr:23S rRNA (adenine(2030)-N(6))-methyltransferase RlmJ [Andreprevotia lacus]SMC26066.1 23S rRNA (adenine2030-N6)-methyltransferase [Andreprevotia lacus DSM 23236]